jgi:hypothetical protein
MNLMVDKTKEQKEEMKAKVQKALTEYAAGENWANSGWDILRYRKAGYIELTDAALNMSHQEMLEIFTEKFGVVKTEYRVLKMAKLGLLKVNEGVFIADGD